MVTNVSIFTFTPFVRPYDDLYSCWIKFTIIYLRPEFEFRNHDVQIASVIHQVIKVS